MLTGRVPFRANGFMGTLSKHIMEPPPSPRQIAPDANISRALELVVLKALAKDPAERYASADDFAAALRALPPARDDEAAPVRRPRWLTSAAAVLLLGGVATWGALGLRSWNLSEAPGPAPAADTPAIVAPPEPTVTPEPAPIVAPEPTPTVAPEPTPTGPPVPAITQEPDVAPKPADPAKKREVKPRPEARLADKLTPAQLKSGFAAVEAAARECRSKHGGVPGTVVLVQLTVTPEGVVEGASARKPYQGTSLGRCVEAAASKARFPRAREGQRAEPGFKL